MKKYYVTIVTPTYNRAHCLQRLYQSICAQNFSAIDWIIVDDGSSDNTKYVISQIISTENSFSVRYFYKENGGKHTALNVGFENCYDSELFLILDSDDLLETDSLTMIYQLWESLKTDPKLCGIIGLCRDYRSGKIIGEKFNMDFFRSTITKNMFYHHRRGDTCDFIRTSYIRSYRFPSLESQRFVPESIVTYDLDKNYEYICVNEVFELKEYQDTGITKNYHHIAMKNSYGMYLRFSHLLSECLMAQMSIKGRLVVLSNYFRYLFKQDNIFSILFELRLDLISTILIAPSFFIGACYHLYDFIKYKRSK